MTINYCKTCGGTLERIDPFKWRCEYCRNVFEDDSVRKENETLRTILGEQKTETVSNLRRNLYDALSERYTDSEEICRICAKIKELLPDDFAAGFYYTANHGTPKEISRAIRGIDVCENSEWIDGIVCHIAKSMRSEYALPLQNLVERAYKNTDMVKYERFSTLISDEMEKVNAGIYETGVPREVFVAYSSKDMLKVEELVEYLESNGLDCFVAARNLRHGRGAKQNYEVALHEAIENCECVVFVSSENSRNMECDALSVELKYIKNTDILNAPPEYRKNYSSMPQKYKKGRVEYRIDNKRTQLYAEKVVTEFFSGLEFAYSPEEVADRIYDLRGADFEEAEETPARSSSKYCARCGAELGAETKFCHECGNNTFVNSIKEYEDKKRSEAEEEKRRLEEQRRAMEEEKRRFEEKQRRIEEENRRKEQLLEEDRKRMEAEKRAAANASRTTTAGTGSYSYTSTSGAGSTFGPAVKSPPVYKPADTTRYTSSPSNNYTPGKYAQNPSQKRTASTSKAEPPMKVKNKWLALFLCYFFGFFGAHKFYEGNKKAGFFYLFTFGVFCIGYVIDLFVLIFKPNPYYVKDRKKRK